MNFESFPRSEGSDQSKASTSGPKSPEYAHIDGGSTQVVNTPANTEAPGVVGMPPTAEELHEMEMYKQATERDGEFYDNQYERGEMKVGVHYDHDTGGYAVILKLTPEEIADASIVAHHQVKDAQQARHIFEYAKGVVDQGVDNKRLSQEINVEIKRMQGS